MLRISPVIVGQEKRFLQAADLNARLDFFINILFLKKS